LLILLFATPMAEWMRQNWPKHTIQYSALEGLI